MLVLCHRQRRSELRRKRKKKENSHLRSPPFPLLPEILDDPRNLLPPRTRINPPPGQTHANLLTSPSHEKPLHQQMPHIQADKNPAILPILLHRRIVQVDEADGPVQQRAEFARHRVRFPSVAWWERVVMECYPVHDGDQEE